MPPWAWWRANVPTPSAGEFKTCFEEQNYGLELKVAIDNLIDRVPLQDLRIVATAIMIQKESGGNLAEVLDKTSYVIRERFRLKRQIERPHRAGTPYRLDSQPLARGAGHRAVLRQSEHDERSVDPGNRRQAALGLGAMTSWAV